MSHTVSQPSALPSGSNQFEQRSVVFVWILALFAIVGSAVTLLGWFADRRYLTDWWGDGISMFPNTAICTAFCGAALLLLTSCRSWAWGLILSRSLAAIVALVGGITLIEHLTGLALGIDTLVAYRPWGQKAAIAPMRMGPPAATSFLLLGTAILMASGTPTARRNASALAFLPLTISFLSFIGYLFNADQLYGVASYTGIARQTSFIIAALSVAVIVAIPEYGFAAALGRADAGGAMLRRLIFPVILFPLLLGWLHLLGRRAEFYDTAFGASLLTLFEVGFLFALLWWTATRMGRHDSAAQEARTRLAAIAESTSDAIVGKTLDGTIQNWNDGAERMFGYSRSEILGKNIRTLIPAERMDEEDSIIGRLKRGERLENFDTVRIRKDGTPIDVSLTIAPLLDSQGIVVGASKIARDITQRLQAEEAIRRSEQELKTMANSLPQLAWMARPDGSIFWYNQRWYQYTGTTFEQMAGWGWQGVHDPEVLPEVLERWKHSLATGESFEMQYPLRGADGEYRWFLTRIEPLVEEQGKVVRWFGTSTDIDQVKNYERQLQEKSETLELLNDAGKLVGSTLELEELLQSVTDVATELSEAKFGAFFYNTKDENGDAYLLYTLAGAPREHFEQFGLPRATPLFASTFSGQATVRSDDILQDPRYGKLAPHFGMPAGHLPVRSYLAVPVVSRMGEVIGGLFFGHPEPGVFTDSAQRIVEGLAAQAGVAVDNARLYENLKRAAREREEILEAEREARSEAERLNMMKDEFLATLSHELRTPLNAILGWTQILALENATQEDFEEGLSVIERNAWAQTKLIEDLLDMSRIISGKIRLEMQSLDLAEAIEQSLESVRPSAEAKQVQIHANFGERVGKVTGDSTRLQQVFWNLLTNAIKFTPKGGSVEIDLRQEGSQVVVAVRDTGVGIDGDFLERVFDRFRQADSSSTRRYGGLGLGLAIVKTLVELHGGTVAASSPGVNQGSTFTVTLPVLPLQFLASDAIFAEQEVANSTRILAGASILVVDDELDARQLLHRVLSQHDAQVTVAGNADEALVLLQSRLPDLIISDIGMPSVDGYEFIRRVRSMPPDRGGLLPAIALTAFARVEDGSRATRAGFQRHLTKPVQTQDLVRNIVDLLSGISN